MGCASPWVPNRDHLRCAQDPLRLPPRRAIGLNGIVIGIADSKVYEHFCVPPPLLPQSQGLGWVHAGRDLIDTGRLRRSRRWRRRPWSI